MGVGLVGGPQENLLEDGLGLPDAARLEDGQSADGHVRGVEGRTGQELRRELVGFAERVRQEEGGQLFRARLRGWGRDAEKRVDLPDQDKG